MKTQEIQLYTFDELSDRAKEKARDWWRNGLDFDHESIFDDAKEVGERMGIDIDDINYSGFSSQGDGASFVGSYRFAPKAKAAVKKYAPKDQDLARIVNTLTTVQAQNKNKIVADVRRTDRRYSHEGTVAIDVSRTDDKDVSEDDVDNVQDALREFMIWIYRRLQDHYDYEMLDETVDENLIANEYDFHADGTLA
jgi:hypothetical protein